MLVSFTNFSGVSLVSIVLLKLPDPLASMLSNSERVPKSLDVLIVFETVNYHWWVFALDVLVLAHPTPLTSSLGRCAVEN